MTISDRSTRSRRLRVLPLVLLFVLFIDFMGWMALRTDAEPGGPTFGWRVVAACLGGCWLVLETVAALRGKSWVQRGPVGPVVAGAGSIAVWLSLWLLAWGWSGARSLVGAITVGVVAGALSAFRRHHRARRDASA